MARKAFCVCIVIFGFAYFPAESIFLVVPEDVPMGFATIFGFTPKIVKGNDHRFGYGFRFGNHADFQVLYELGPQTITRPLQQPINTQEYKDHGGSVTGNINPASVLERGELVVKKVLITSGHTMRKGKYNPYECPQCTYTSIRKGDLETHLRVHTGEKPFECEMCHQKFKDKSNLRVHLRIHTGDKPFRCPICEHDFKHISNLKKHLRVHNGEKPYECSVCLFKFSEKSALTAHVRTHTGESPFECAICHCKFKNKGNLKIHFRRHTGDKPFVCSICERRFIQKSSLDRHLRSHSGLKPFECEICKRKYTQRSSLNVHLRSQHADSIVEQKLFY